MKKLTKRDKFEMILAIEEVKGNELLVEFIQHELDLLAKKNATTGLRKPTKTQLENDNLIETIFNHLASVEEGKTISDLQNELEELQELSNQKISALLKKLVDTDKVQKYVDKKKTFFKIAE